MKMVTDQPKSKDLNNSVDNRERAIKKNIILFRFFFQNLLGILMFIDIYYFNNRHGLSSYGYIGFETILMVGHPGTSWMLTCSSMGAFE